MHADEYRDLVAKQMTEATLQAQVEQNSPAASAGSSTTPTTAAAPPPASPTCA